MYDSDRLHPALDLCGKLKVFFDDVRWEAPGDKDWDAYIDTNTKEATSALALMVECES